MGAKSVQGSRPDRRSSRATPGTGKTMSAEVIAGDLGLDLYVIDLSTVVDKYIGETEKNLDRIFAEADRVNAVLLFDEADALFGKRSEVKRRARPLRERRGRVPAPADGAVRRRRDPDHEPAREPRRGVHPAARRDRRLPDARGAGSTAALGASSAARRCRVPTDIDVDFLARAFKLSGGNIRNICVAAAFFAAAEDGPVTMARLDPGHGTRVPEARPAHP